MVKSSETFSDDWMFIKEKLDVALTPPGKREHEKKKKANRKSLVAGLIDYFVKDTKAKRAPGAGHSRYEYALDIPEDRVRQCAVLKAIVWEAIINDANIATLERKARTIVRGLFEEFHDWTNRPENGRVNARFGPS